MDPAAFPIIANDNSFASALPYLLPADVGRNKESEEVRRCLFCGEESEDRRGEVGELERGLSIASGKEEETAAFP